MDWQELCNRRDLQNLPFKIELDAQGKVMNWLQVLPNE
jgi:hypothetical protein